MVDLGMSRLGAPLRMNRRLVDSDLLIAVGWTEPHAYAGFSGGWKTAVIGCASEEFIGATHSPRFIGHEASRPGCLSDNPFQETLREAGEAVGLAFTVNIVPVGDRAGAAAAGNPARVIESLAAQASDLFAIYRGAPADVIVTGIHPPKDRELYQASRGATNLILGPSPACREGGVVIIPARLKAGAGEGKGGERFATLMQKRYEEILGRPANQTFKGGEQRAWVIAQAFANREMILAGPDAPERYDGMAVTVAPDLADALMVAAERTGGGRLIVFPDAISAFSG